MIPWVKKDVKASVLANVGCRLPASRFPPDTVILSASEESRYRTLGKH